MNQDLSNTLFAEIIRLIEESRLTVARKVNESMSMLYWRVGELIKRDVLKEKRAEYGKKIIDTLASQLSTEYGAGWSKQQLRHCLRAAEIFPHEEIFSAVRRELTWTHIKTIIYIEDELKRTFYLELCKLENWTSRQLQERVNSMLFERTAISKKPDETIQNELKQLKTTNNLSPDLVFRDPYFLSFLGLADTYSEKDLENAILAELQKFIIELGSDFAFLSRQKRITIDKNDYFIDLLFFHRRLRCLVAIDLKLGEFEAGYKGQMELYLRYLEKHEQVEGENSPIGLILCSGKNEEHIELLQLHSSNIRVADYLTALPSKELLQKKLHKAIEIARARIKEEPAQREKILK